VAITDGVTNSAQYYLVYNTLFDGQTWVPAPSNATNYANAVYFNYIVFSGLTNDEILIRGQDLSGGLDNPPGPGTCFAGIQIVAQRMRVAPLLAAPAYSPTNVVFAGSPVTVTANVIAGTLPIYFQWQTDGGGGGSLTNIPGATTNTLNVIPPDIGQQYAIQYCCIGSNSFGVSISATNTLTVLPVYSVPTISGFSAFFSNTNPVTGSRTVTLNATVNPNNLPTTAFFQYGLTTSYAGGSAPVNLPAACTGSNISASLDSIVPGVVYHWQVVASNSLGGVSSLDQTFYKPSIYPPGETNADGVVDQNELNAVLANYWPNSPWVSMTNVAGLGSLNVQFALTNANNWDFSVLVSTDLIDWQYLGPATPMYQFVDPQATNGPTRFYRLSWP
jgi:hypothetical protein